MAGSYWDRIATQRMTRRRMLQRAGAAGAAAGAIWVVGCGGGDDDDGNGNGNGNGGQTPAATTPSGNGITILNEKNPPVPGGRIVYQTSADFGTWDAHVSVAASANYFPVIYNLLLSQSNLMPEFFFFDLAESYENPDENTFAFKIRKDAMIGPNDLGVPERVMTAEDAAATFNRIKAEPKAGNGAIKPFLGDVAASGDIFTMKTTSPYAWMIYRVGIYTSTIPPMELTNAPDKMITKSAGAAQMRLVSSTEGEIARMDKNPSYYRKDEFNNNAQLPYRDGLDLRIIRDRAAVRTAFIDGQISIYGAESKADADDIVGKGNFFVVKDPQTTFIAFTMNPDQAPFNDPRARKAVNFALNRQQYVDLVYDGDAEANGLVHWPQGDYAFRGDELKEVQPFDLAEAKKLIEALGGLKFKMIYPASSNIQQHDQHLPIFLKQMEDAGIEIEQDPQDFSTWYTNYQQTNYVASLSLNQSYETPEVPLDFQSRGGPLADGSFAKGSGDPEVEAAIKKTKSTFDVKERIQAVRDAQKVIYEKGPTFLPIATPFGYTVYSGKLHNIRTGLGGVAGGLMGVYSWQEA